jgi:hypothetical protein
VPTNTEEAVMDPNVGHARALLASVLLSIAGVLNIVWGIAAISNSHFFVNHAQFVFSNLHGWGWITLIVGILELIAAASLVAGHAFGQWFAIAVGSIAAVEALLAIPAYPFWSLAIFLLSLWIVYGVAQYEPA